VIRGFSINNSHTHEVWSYDKHKAECCGIVISLIELIWHCWRTCWELVWWQWFVLLLCSSSCIEFLLLMRVFKSTWVSHGQSSYSVNTEQQHNFDLSWKAIMTKLLLFFILASSINSAIKKSKVEVVNVNELMFSMTKTLNVNSRLLRRTVSITQSEKVEFISCKHCDKVFSWST
jgi:hypothetical protein